MNRDIALAMLTALVAGCHLTGQAELPAGPHVRVLPNNVNRGAPGPDLAADGNPGTENVRVTVANGSRAPLADSPKGMWGRVTPIADGNHPAVDYWADSGWPHDLLTFDGVTFPGGAYPSDAANRYDLVMYLLAVYPSGANTDTYGREGYRLPESEWNTTDYTSGGYHFAQMSGAVLGAEMAYHNGMTVVFGLTDTGTEPALLRHWKRAIQSRKEIDRRPGNPFGHPIIGYSQELWPGYRRYADPTIEGAVSTLTDSKTDETELPAAVWEFFGYPRRIVPKEANPATRKWHR